MLNAMSKYHLMEDVASRHTGERAVEILFLNRRRRLLYDVGTGRRMLVLFA